MKYKIMFKKHFKIIKEERLTGTLPYRTSLRDKCVLQYGEHFGELYDKSCRGESIGNITQTKLFLEAIEKVRGYE